ncbi:MAG: rod shape-determining protein [Chloroflexi bacterium]|nr:rod shape-determining protein [Chloroflexota bacterium]
MFERYIGIDLGTVNVLVYMKGRGIVLQEPSVVAISRRDSKIVAIGQEAREMVGRNPESIEVAHPLKDGVIADYEVTEKMLAYFIRKLLGRFRLVKPILMVSVPRGVTSVESRAVYDAAMQAGAREAYLIPEPLAAALGAGLPIEEPTGNMVVDLGGGTTESAVVSVGDIVSWSSVRVGGNRLDEAIMAYVRRKYNLIIGQQTAEEIKIGIGSALPLEEELSMEVKGRDQVTGLPKTITITSGEVMEALEEPLSIIVDSVRQTLEKTPPELAADIIDRGMVLTGGTALLRQLDRLLIQKMGVPVYVADNPIACVAIGAGRALENLDVIRRSLPKV